MSGKLYVGNVPSEIVETTLQELFARAGASRPNLGDELAASPVGAALVKHVSEYTRGAVRKAAPARAVVGRPADRRGPQRVGHIVRLFIGQGHGLIRRADDRDVFFHRSDVREGTSFNEFAVGDPVIFELLDDHVSGPRAVNIERRQDRR